jgi:hypothetical protein
MLILQATGDVRKVSLWLGHAQMQTTEAYLRADPTDKLAALEAVIPPALRRGHFTVPDKLIALLRGEGLHKDSCKSGHRTRMEGLPAYYTRSFWGDNSPHGTSYTRSWPQSQRIRRFIR